jgi:hypothetical protein
MISCLNAVEKSFIERKFMERLQLVVSASVSELADTGEINSINIEHVLKYDFDSSVFGHTTSEELRKVVGLFSVKLKPVSPHEGLLVKATDGRLTIANSGDVFASWIDGDFEIFGTNVSQAATSVSRIWVYEALSEYRFNDFLIQNPEQSSLRLSQSQIVDCVQSYRYILPADQSTFFMFAVEDKSFVTSVTRYADETLSAHVCRMSEGSNWDFKQGDRIVVSRPLR